MPNIRLKNGYKWTTDGIYDTTQAKTQAAINADIAEVAEVNENLILLQNTEPIERGNKIWIKEGVSYTIPTVADMTDAIAVETAAREAADSDLQTAITNKLFIKSGTISSAHTSAATTTLATDTAKINASTDIANVWFSDPSLITSDYTVATNASGQVTINCTNSAQVTVYVVLFNP